MLDINQRLVRIFEDSLQCTVPTDFNIAVKKLGLNSINLLKFISIIEEEFGIVIDESDIRKTKTIGEWSNLISSKIQNGK